MVTGTFDIFFSSFCISLTYTFRLHLSLIHPYSRSGALQWLLPAMALIGESDRAAKRERQRDPAADEAKVQAKAGEDTAEKVEQLELEELGGPERLQDDDSAYNNTVEEEEEDDRAFCTAENAMRQVVAALFARKSKKAPQSITEWCVK